MTDFLEIALTKFGKIQLQLSPPLIRACHCRQVLSLAKPGMIIARRFNCYADGLVIPGDYSHSGVVESAEVHNGTVHNDATVIHAVAEGVGRIDLLDFVKDADGVALIEYDGGSMFSGQMDVVNFARSMIGHPYDFRFSLMDDGKAVYCHELSARALEAAGIKIIPEVRYAGPVAREIYTYTSLATNGRARVVWEAQVQG